jgi:hypothetical protein
MAKANDVVEVVIHGRNIMPVELMHIPIEYAGTLALALDSFSLVGCRTEGLGTVIKAHSDASDKEVTFRIYSINPESHYLEPGYGPVLKVYFTAASWATPGQTATISLEGYSIYMPEFRGLYVSSYAPATAAGTVGVYACGDANSDRNVNLLDVTFTVNFLYKNGPEPNPPNSADANGDANINILDVTHLVNYLYKSGPDPAC